MSGPTITTPTPSAGPPPPRRTFPIPALLIGLGVLVIIGSFLWPRDRPDTETGVPAPSTLTSTQPSTQPTSLAPPVTPASSTDNGADEVILTEDSARQFLTAYYELAPWDPAASWELTTQLRQDTSDFDDYLDFWAQVTKADIELLALDGSLATSDVTLTMTNGDTVRESRVKTWLWVEDGEIRIDTAGAGSSPEQSSARDTMNTTRAADLERLRLDGGWAVVLSTKRPGIEDSEQIAANGSHYFYDTDILALHQDLASRFGNDLDIMLVRTSDFGKQSPSGQVFWRTIGVGFRSQDDAAAWCASRFSGTKERIENFCLPSPLVASHD
ncbi:MAG: hypothetical protein ACK5LN_13580 [Propioniciclava sp.]